MLRPPPYDALAMDAPAALAAAAAAAAAAQQHGQMLMGQGIGTVTLVSGPAAGAPRPPTRGPPGSVQPMSSGMPSLVNVNGTMRRLQAVCAQALPWSTSFIGCPGIRAGEGVNDFTQLFKVGVLQVETG